MVLSRPRNTALDAVLREEAELERQMRLARYERIRKVAAANPELTGEELAERFNCTRATIGKILGGRELERRYLASLDGKASYRRARLEAHR